MQVVEVRRSLVRLLQCVVAAGRWRRQFAFLIFLAAAVASTILSFSGATTDLTRWLRDPSSVFNSGTRATILSFSGATTDLTRWLRDPSSVFNSGTRDLANSPELSPPLSPPLPPPLSPPSRPSPTELPSPLLPLAPAEAPEGDGSLVDASGSSPSRLSHEISPHLLTSAEWQLVLAKSQIARAPVVQNDPDLYAPLFHNVSIFTMSYELMERTLKVYIYREGPVPLCHTPILSGIYASEGWFMRSMEAGNRFLTEDPNDAHLFYLPYSSVQLRAHLHDVPDSHSNRPLAAIFLRDYVKTISGKYPFWNMTGGKDHFSVGCHDWAPNITRLHDELRANSIKAMCNADVSDHVFVRGKDVSLPVTNVMSTPKRPQKNVGGKLASKRPILAFFAGRMHGRVRPVLLQHWKDMDEDMKIYEFLPRDVAWKMSYEQHMKSSKFCICPEVNSPMIVESIHYECVPVIIADNFVLPFEELLNWSAFSVVVAEKDIPKLRDILVGISPSQYLTMQKNVRMVQKHFLWNLRPRRHDLFHMILHSIWFNRLQQIHFPE